MNNSWSVFISNEDPILGMATSVKVTYMERTTVTQNFAWIVCLHCFRYDVYTRLIVISTAF